MCGVRVYRVAVGNDVREYLNVSFRRGAPEGSRGRGGRMVASRRNFIKRVFACFHSGHARFYRLYNAAGSERHDNTIQFVVTTRHVRIRVRDIRACVRACIYMNICACTHTRVMHACIPEERAGVLRARQNDRCKSYVMSLRVC